MINLVSDIIILLCLVALMTAILINFAEQNRQVRKEKKSVVETGSMTAFFIFFYLLIRFKLGHLELPETILIILKPIGLIAIVAGTYINIRSRKTLGTNWANQVTLYANQRLVSTGIYKYIRHPLYSSLIGMFYGACLVYPNYLAFLANTLIFLPFMYYRAKQEENLLKQSLPGYSDYIQKTGMFIPKLFRHETDTH
ncbi:isoprenylcysteine carboxylmethyltransferase family protein [Mangrovibacterium marinum]|uniref:Protein-S-isoprenylcysteine O-methyltransferase Ste14 n=1 Tax=Mangrovibacterium marinum TaxID=1639118 RepID=A0A2T5C466_9BACT|nr:isoprenylcysteine carboxylmethyltransferase family protein [Mangrovibacterium marinum]PTN09599.1 protein-S-isoprenylcysteine O-methyltransferase Ste14 [Mangrovibacterium marinum]